jgi:hypothetical protein
MFAAFIWLLMFPGVLRPDSVFAERGLLYRPAPRVCFSRHFGPGPRM